MTDPSAPLLTGGCQCGEVRYSANAPLEMVHYCHCRMCQRALGSPFALVAGVPREKLVLTRGNLRWFASSSLAERGFCFSCGTPMTISYAGSLYTYITIGSLDHPELAVPEEHYGVESKLSWLHVEDDLPRHATLDDPRLDAMIVHQFQRS